MDLAMVYVVIMWLWTIGAYIWVLAAMKSDNTKFFLVAGMYALMALINGMVALTLSAHGQ